MKSKRPYNFDVRVEADGSHHICIHGVIGEYIDYERWTVSDTEQDVLNELAKIPEGSKIHVHINSRGGDVGLGLGMYNALSRRKKDVTTYNDGYAMSAAVLPFLAGSCRISPAASIGMIHRALAGVDGTGDDMRTMADGMDVIDEAMAKVMAEVSGKHSKEHFLDLMDKTTFYDGEKAVEYGLATECKGDVDEDEEITDCERKVVATFEKKIPENLRTRVMGKTRPAPRAQAGATPAANQQPTKKSMKLITAALVAAGYSVPTDADEQAVLPVISSIIAKNGELKAANDAHEKARKERVTAKVEKAIADKLIKAERKDALIKAGVADETTLEFIDDIRAEAATHTPRGAKPAKRVEGEEADDTDTQIENLHGEIAGDISAEKRGELVAQSIKLRGLDGLFKKREVKAQAN